MLLAEAYRPIHIRPGRPMNQPRLHPGPSRRLQLTPAFSRYLDLLRFLAALLVCLAHAGHIAQARLPILGRNGSPGVIAPPVWPMGVAVPLPADVLHQGAAIGARVDAGALYVGAIYLLPLAVAIWLALLCELLKRPLATRLQHAGQQPQRLARPAPPAAPPGS